MTPSAAAASSALPPTAAATPTSSCLSPATPRPVIVVSMCPALWLPLLMLVAPIIVRGAVRKPLPLRLPPVVTMGSRLRGHPGWGNGQTCERSRGFPLQAPYRWPELCAASRRRSVKRARRTAIRYLKLPAEPAAAAGPTPRRSIMSE